MPGIRDPGYELVREAVQAGVQVVPIPGPSAVTTALAVSGLPSDRFLFLGFLPSRRKERLKELKAVSSHPYTLVTFEAPHRLLSSLEDMAAILGGDRPLTVCRELTKLHEEVYRGTVAETLAHFHEPRGEFTLVIAGAHGREQAEEALSIDAMESLRKLKASGATTREAVTQVAATYRLPRRQVYQMWVKMRST